jgi:glycosyltransferase involved in cell wall biosynthesis
LSQDAEVGAKWNWKTILRGLRTRSDMALFPITSLGELSYESQVAGIAEVVTVISLYNYADTVVEALESVVNQDIHPLSIIVIDDCSTDHGGDVAAAFLRQQGSRFAHARVVRHNRNQGLAMARNSGIAWTSEPYLFMLDADNLIRPPALSRLLRALKHSGAGFAYSQLFRFGREITVGDADIWEPSRLLKGNYIDAMAMICRGALRVADGYRVSAVEEGWEDYDLWCRFADLGLEGIFLPELLCGYRVHSDSMSRTRTNEQHQELMAELRHRYPNLFQSGV